MLFRSHLVSQSRYHENEGNLLGTFGENGTSVFGWWVLQDAQFQQNYSNQFALVMAQEIVAGTAE